MLFGVWSEKSEFAFHFVFCWVSLHINLWMHAHALDKLGLPFHLFTFHFTYLFIHIYTQTQTIRTIFNRTMCTHHLWETVGIESRCSLFSHPPDMGGCFQWTRKQLRSNVSQNLAFMLNGALLNWGILKWNALEAAWYVEKSKGLEYRGLATCPWGALGNLLTFPEPQWLYLQDGCDNKHLSFLERIKKEYLKALG